MDDSITLRRMSQAEYTQYYPAALASLTNELAGAYGSTPECMLAWARRSFESLLPEGSPGAPGHNVKILVDHTGLNGLQVSGNFKINDLDGLLSALTIMLPIEVTRPDSSSIKLSAK